MVNPATTVPGSRPNSGAKEYGNEHGYEAYRHRDAATVENACQEILSEVICPERVGKTGTSQGYSKIDVVNAVMIYQRAKECAQHQRQKHSHTQESQTVPAKAAPAMPPQAVRSGSSQPGDAIRGRSHGSAGFV
jgi:hypothetical protein